MNSMLLLVSALETSDDPKELAEFAEWIMKTTEKLVHHLDWLEAVGSIPEDQKREMTERLRGD
jgi:hypothetical protein